MADPLIIMVANEQVQVDHREGENSEKTKNCRRYMYKRERNKGEGGRAMKNLVIAIY